MEETLGKRIIAHRKRMGMTQDRLAEQLGVTAQAVSKWENDQSCPDITMLPKLSQLFGTSVDSLLGCENQAPAYEAEVVHAESSDDAKENDGIHIHKGNWEFQFDNSRKSSIGAALWVLLVGCILLAGEFLNKNFGFWDVLWPSALLVFGLMGILPRFSLFRVCATLIGGYYLADAVGILPVSFGRNLILPVILVVLGLNQLVDSIRKPEKRHISFSHNGKNHKRSRCEVTEDAFDCNLSFGEVNTVIDAQRLQRGEASVSFGELTLDLSGCKEIADGCAIDATCSFGELTLEVPSCYRVEADASTSFGNFEFKGHPDSEVAAVIRLDASVSFGEICVKYI